MPVRTDLGPRSLYLAGSHVSNMCAGSITWTSTLIMRGSSPTECPCLPQRLHLHVVVPEHVPQHVHGVLTHGRRLLGERQVVADDLDRRGQLIGAQPFLGDPLETLLELRILH